MTDYQLMKLIEEHGCVNDRGERIYGTAALLHFLHRPIKSIKPEHMKLRKEFIESLLSA